MNPKSDDTHMADAPGKKPEKPDKGFVIHIDRKQFKVDRSPLTGAEIRQLAGLTPDVDLYLEERGDDDDRLIADDDSVDLRNGLHFFSTPRHITPGRV
jgi:Multiubiquitin